MNRIRKFTRTLATSGIISNDRLIKAHLGSFFAATTTNLITFLLSELSKDFESFDIKTKKRLAIAGDVLSIFGVFAWTIANCFVMVIFVKYGKPLEDDWEKLIQTKLFDSFEN